MNKTNNYNIIVNKPDEHDICLKHDINNEIKRFGTCIDKYGNYEYYYHVRENIIKMC